MPPRGLAACALVAPLLGGCAAAVAVPLLAAGTIAVKSIKEDGRERAEAVSAFAATTETPAAFASLTTLTELPKPLPRAAGPWAEFADYALDRSQAVGGADPVASALLASSSLALPDRASCAVPTAAVMIDLDEGPAAFQPAPGALPSPGLVQNLARLREANVVVLWISSAEANRVSEIGDFLRNSGLDPTGRDPLLLARKADERKQLMRRDASASVCVLAIAGDRRSDFDELFDYLRDPRAAASLDFMLGDGWFLASPLASTAPN